MTKRQVWQYWCSFCGKHNLSAASIAKHEKHCTANPARVCRMCKASGGEQLPIAELIACIDLRKADQGLSDLTDASGNCPACILATLRQCEASMPGYTLMRGSSYAFGAVDDESLGPTFDFKAACKSWLDEYNNAQLEREGYY